MPIRMINPKSFQHLELIAFVTVQKPRHVHFPLRPENRRISALFDSLIQSTTDNRPALFFHSGAAETASNRENTKTTRFRAFSLSNIVHHLPVVPIALINVYSAFRSNLVFESNPMNCQALESNSSVARNTDTNATLVFGVNGILTSTGISSRSTLDTLEARARFEPSR